MRVLVVLMLVLSGLFLQGCSTQAAYYPDYMPPQDSDKLIQAEMAYEEGLISHDEFMEIAREETVK